MSDFFSDYEEQLCPFCGVRIGSNKNPDGLWVNDLEEDGMEFFQCHKCNNFFKAELSIFKEYNYIIRVPSDKEVEEYGLTCNKVTDKDCPGQTFIWDNLFLNKS